jgi:hypothetical protein
MILRAGRWHTDKNLFHILFPITREEDLGGMEEVLISLASADETLKEEIENLCLTIGKKKEDEKDLEVKCEKLNGFIIDDYSADHIMIECIDGFDTSRLKDSFKTTCGKIRDYRERNIILELCRKEGVNTSLNYKKLQEANSFLPEDPRKKGETWFDFLNPSVIKIDIREFVNEICVKNNILDAKSYMEFSKNPISIQNILDGYYGDETNFNSIMIKYRVLKRASRR